MTEVLAIETATDACSVAVTVGERIVQRHEIAPRQHSRRLFEMLEELFPEGNLAERGVTAIAYGCGPGSFTGLRIAASATQGLAFASGLPAVAVPTLAILAQTAFIEEEVPPDQSPVLCTLDARLDELYAAVYRYELGLPVLSEGPWACAPEDLPVRATSALHVVGNGACYVDRFPVAVRRRLAHISGEVMPRARDMIPLARHLLAQGETQRAEEVRPVYVRDEMSWKKLHEQGNRQ